MARKPPFLKPTQDLGFFLNDGPPTNTVDAPRSYPPREQGLIWSRKRGSVAGKKGVKNRREKPNPGPIIEFIEKKLNRDRDISSHDMVAALKAVADTDGPIEMSDDGAAFVVIDGDGKEKNRLAIKSVPATVSRLRKKFEKSF